MPIPELTIAALTEATADGTETGVFDMLMRSVKAHLDEEFKKGRIKGPEYSTVYLGSLDLAMQNGMAFLMNSRKVNRELELLDKQLALADKSIEKAQVELDILEAQLLKIPEEKNQIIAQTNLLAQQRTNAVTENTVLIAQECKLRAEYDFTVSNTLRSNEERTLLVQKVATEKAQTQALGVDDNSVIGKQKLLYGAQADGFKRDAEQKVAKLLADTWSVRRTTDEGTVADGVNMLNDSTVGRAMTKLLAGIGA